MMRFDALALQIFQKKEEFTFCETWALGPQSPKLPYVTEFPFETLRCWAIVRNFIIRINELVGTGGWVEGADLGSTEQAMCSKLCSYGVGCPSL